MRMAIQLKKAAPAAKVVRVMIASLVLWLALLGQVPHIDQRNTNEERAQELENDKEHTFQDLLNRNPEAVANAKEYFAVVSDPKLKQRVASILLSIGVKDPIYFDYLSSEATKALQNDIPWPTLYDERGEINKDALNPKFLAWCRGHRSDPSDAHMAAYYEIPVPWYYLAAAGDPRSYDLLVQGLRSHNLMIAAWASWGLAKLQDPKAVDELIVAGHSLPGEARAAIAEALLHFPDHRAQAAADELMTDKKHLEVARREVRKKGLKALFPY